MSKSDMRLAGICKDCIKRLGVNERLTMPLNYVQVSKLPEYNSKAMHGIQYPASSQAFGLARTANQGTTKITYKIAKTVKESIDDAASNTSHASHSGHSSNGKSATKKQH